MSLERDPATTNHTILIFQVKEILAGAERLGHDVGSLLNRADISPTLLESPLSRVSQAQYARLTRVLRNTLRDEFFGLCSHPLRVGSFSHMCHRLIQCDTLGEAMRYGFSFYHMMIDDFTARLSVKNDVARVRITRSGGAPAQGCYAERLFLFFSMGIASWLVARRLPLTQLHFLDMERNREPYVKMLFQAPVSFATGELGFDFEARWLDLPVAQNSLSVRTFLHQAPSSLLVKYRDHTSITERVRRLLRRHLSGEMPTLEDVGQVFGMTPQTLRRRLADEGHTYQALKDSLRCDAAIEYLSRLELSLVDIAGMVGFSEPSTFHRAFKKWTGLPPGEYRSRRLQSSAYH
ncbi:AraC family transcriptional regulator [Isoalcanivorax beigongshangi]|uniref:AraC family transcriptional regulator ligand-binding domain-containing protein n=1 Tax=Isoalcanivorax beigongshangi TaxID=3238810 RepID=A0ABV4AKY5_9GAMM